MLFSLFQKIEPSLVRFYRGISTPPPPNLLGDRYVEYSWIASRISSGPGMALDFGAAGPGYCSFIAAERGFRVIALDKMPIRWHFAHPHITILQRDLFESNLQENSIDLILNCSSVEHTGLSGRYNDQEGSNEDIKAMEKMHSLLRENGNMLLTVPVGQDAVFAPLHRVYGEERLPRLLAKYKIHEEVYWVKDKENKWIVSDRATALSFAPKKHTYNLGCFTLKKE